MESILDLPNPLQHKARNAYEAFILEGVEKGMKEGLEKGARQNLIKNVKGIHLNGASIEFIANSLQLTRDQVEAILKEEDF